MMIGEKGGVRRGRLEVPWEEELGISNWEEGGGVGGK